MTKKNKLIDRFKKLPKDFEFDEVDSMLKGLGFESSTKGKTSGSRMAYLHKKEQCIIRIHKPHPGNIIGPATLKDIYNTLKENDFIK
jgi:predicted RNA binding protein YcfA (HicA-like mRNA interferase family)